MCIFSHVSMCRKYNHFCTMCFACVLGLGIIGWIFISTISKTWKWSLITAIIFYHTCTATTMAVGMCNGISTKALLLHVHSGTHNDVIKWKHVLHYWPFVRGIHRSLWALWVEGNHFSGKLHRRDKAPVHPSDQVISTLLDIQQVVIWT